MIQQFAHTPPQTYTSLLALLQLTLKGEQRRLITKHLLLLLLVPFVIYFQRDLWPLATFSLSPIDGAAGWLTWSRVGLLGFSGVLLPLLTPREYVPLDPLVRPIPPKFKKYTHPFFIYLFRTPMTHWANRRPHHSPSFSLASLMRSSGPLARSLISHMRSSHPSQTTIGVDT